MEREIELVMKKMLERLMETREHNEHIGNSNQRNQRNQILSKTTCSFLAYTFRFIEMKDTEVTAEVALHRFSPFG